MTTEWTYSRGRWSRRPNYDAYETAETRGVHEWLRKDDLARRWRKFPVLGPVPEKWVNTGPEPGINGMMKAFYLAPVSFMLNESSPLRETFR